MCQRVSNNMEDGPTDFDILIYIYTKLKNHLTFITVLNYLLSRY